MHAILWDGNKQLKGRLILGTECLRFELDDFAGTALDFELKYVSINHIDYHKVYGINPQGLEIVSNNTNRNVFIVDKPIHVRELINAKLDLLRK